MARLSPEQAVLGHRAAVGLVRQKVAAFAQAAWNAQGNYRDADVDRLVRLIAPRVEAGQVQIANLTSAYIANVATLRGTKRIEPIRVDRGLVTGGRGVPATEVYRRPAVTVYRALSEGKPFEEARKLGALRLAKTVLMDLQMSQVRQADASYRAGGFRKYQRVLSAGDNCALCIIASTQEYLVGELLPIHPGCGCTTDSISSANPWDPEAKARLLEDTHAKVREATGVSDRGGRAPDYRNLIATREHGEYGPTLTLRRDRFTGQDDL